MKCSLAETSWSTHEYSLASLQRMASESSRVAYHQPYNTPISPGLLHTIKRHLISREQISVNPTTSVSNLYLSQASHNFPIE